MYFNNVRFLLIVTFIFSFSSSCNKKRESRLDVGVEQAVAPKVEASEEVPVQETRSIQNLEEAFALPEIVRKENTSTSIRFDPANFELPVDVRLTKSNLETIESLYPSIAVETLGLESQQKIKIDQMKGSMFLELLWSGTICDIDKISIEQTVEGENIPFAGFKSIVESSPDCIVGIEIKYPNVRIVLSPLEDNQILENVGETNNSSNDSAPTSSEQVEQPKTDPTTPILTLGLTEGELSSRTFRLSGQFDSQDQVTFFASSDCTGTSLGEVSGSDATTPGFEVNLDKHDIFNVFSSFATFESKTSDCSNAINFVRQPQEVLTTTTEAVNSGTLFFNKLVDHDGKMYFKARSGHIGDEIYVTDGTPEGTKLVANINKSGSSSPNDAVVFQGKIYFTAETDLEGRWLFQLNPDDLSLTKVFNVTSSQIKLFADDSIMYFSDFSTDFGGELYTTDGTAIGTSLLKDINPGTATSGPSEFMKGPSGKVYFRATTAAEGNELWVTDGTESGTQLLKDINPGSANSFPQLKYGDNTYLFFDASDSTNGREIWRTDGTTVGTILLADTAPGTANGAALYVVPFDNKYYFTASSTAEGRELFSTDGTPGNTVLVQDINLGAADSWPSNYVVLNDKLLFRAQGPDGYELWYTDGTTVAQLKDINPGANSSGPVYTAKIGNKVYFTADDGTNGKELWETDGTAANTRLVMNLADGSDGTNITGIFEVNGRLVFLSSHTNLGTELFTSDGTVESTFLLKGISRRPNAQFHIASRLGNELVFFGPSDGGAKQYALWRGLPPYDNLVKMFETDYDAFIPFQIVKLGNTWFFQGDDSELWSSEGTEAGTALFVDLHSSGNSQPESFVKLPNHPDKFFFVATSADAGRELFVSDGTVPGTVVLKDIEPGTSGSWPEGLEVSGNLLYFQAADTDGYELWVSDGTSAGTKLVKDIEVGGDSYPEKITALGNSGKVVFSADDSAHGEEIWVSDGTEAGTILLQDIITGSTGSSPEYIQTVGNEVYFVAYHDNGDQGLFRTDGTPTGTSEIIRLTSGTTIDSKVVPAKDHVYFLVSGSSKELWVSDGTTPGTQKLSLPDGVVFSELAYGAVDPGTNWLYFYAVDPEIGMYLWRTDGTTENTQRLHPIYYEGIMSDDGENYYHQIHFFTESHFFFNSIDEGYDWKLMRY